MTDSRAACDLVGKGEAFDAILCDLAMPRVSGVHVREYVMRRAPSLLDRLVFVTGMNRDYVVEQFPQLTSSVFLRKPFDAERILALVRRIAGQPWPQSVT
jgi:CheY-like chemotaxis protein